MDTAFGTRLLLLLMIQKMIDSDQAAEARESEPQLPEKYLVERGIVNRQQLATVVAESFDAETASGEVKYLADTLPEPLQKKHYLFPIVSGSDDSNLVLAATVPGTSECTEELEQATNRTVRYVIIDRLTVEEHFESLDKPPSPEISTDTPPAVVLQTPAVDLPVVEEEPVPAASDATEDRGVESFEEFEEDDLDIWISGEESADESDLAIVAAVSEAVAQEPEESVEPPLDATDPEPTAPTHEAETAKMTYDLPSAQEAETAKLSYDLSPEEEVVPTVEPEPVMPEPEAVGLSNESTEPEEALLDGPTMTEGAPSLRPSELLIGGRYRRGKKLLEGRFSTLYGGKDERTGLPVAVRHLESFSHLNDVMGGPEEAARAQTLREGRVLSTLFHPGLPRIRRLVQHGDDIYLVGDPVKGRSLAEEIEQHGALDPELVRRYFIKLLRVIDYLHCQSPAIIHRDLRADTVMVSQNGGLCLAEFGLAKMEQNASAKPVTNFRSAGDPHFAPPEQLMGELSSPSNDLYAAGALAYYMATGKKPPPSLSRFAGQSEMEPLPSELDTGVANAILGCLAPRLEERSYSAEELLRRLDFRGVRTPEIADSSDELSAVVADEPVAVQAIGKRRTNRFVPTAAPKKRSMWSLLFGRKENSEEELAPIEEDTAAIDRQLATIPFVDLTSIEITREVSSILPESLCRAIHGICLEAPDGNAITVACDDPTDVYVYDKISIATQDKYQATLVRADSDLIEHALEFVYEGEQLGSDAPWSKFLELKRLHDVVLETTSEQAELSFGDEALEGPIVDAVEQIVKQAISAGASDIHLEPYDTGMDVRYRIDGVLRKVSHYDRQDAGAIVKRLKVLANMDIAQERITQGGRISLRVSHEEYDLRVSIVPVPVGESVVMRILKKGAFTLTLSDLGFSEDREIQFRRILAQPHGMVLVCGPTGSGKSTTLYASLKEIQRPDRKLLTAEDPIEYQMPGIIQVQMNTNPREEEKKVTFSKTLREFLRQDPDVILVGEIRDQETAEIGIQAALTGHLLLSTLHTNDSVGIIARLRDMNCEPFQIGSVLLGGLAQRLARKICPDCRYEVPVPDDELHRFEECGIAKPRMFEGRGCRKCHQSGSRGRIGLYELLEVSPEIRAHINRGDREEDIRKTATSQGFKDLLTDGMEKVSRGLVTLDEVLRVCKSI